MAPVNEPFKERSLGPEGDQDRRLLRKIDARVIPILSTLYLLALIDRTNIANAAVYGLTTDLGISTGSTDYNTALTMFFILCVLFEIPSNLILRSWRPRVWLPTCMLVFGILTVCQGLVSSIGGLYVVRLLLGLAEAGILPGCCYLIGMWYKRSEAQKRFTFFFSSASLAGAFSGPLAVALSHLDGLGGYRAWRWTFIVEGLLTVVYALICFFLTPDFPETATFLTEAERKLVRDRLEKELGQEATDCKLRLVDVAKAFKSYKIVLGGLMYLGVTVPAYGFAFLAPMMVSEYDYSPVQTQLISVAPGAVAFVFAMILAFFADLTKFKFPFIVLSLAVAITGFAVRLAPHVSNAIEYGGLFLIATGTYSAMPMIVCWFTMNLRGHGQRAVGSAWQIGFGNIGGMISTYAFLPRDAPRYLPGHLTCMAFIVLSWVCCSAYFMGCHLANRKRDPNIHVGDMSSRKLDDTRSGPRYML